ncbi:BolA family transcriptional regulator [Elioraea sp.]|uniref:BolA family protein n=1 Tax=Elioraea sp. TaxID=2185103 RepID=UPI0025BB3B19|nr:BolA family protein [Elioraea sp.]
MTEHRAARIRAALEAALAPAEIAVVDDSASHAGHAGNPDGAGETHYTVHAISPVFAGEGRVARQRRVHAALATEFATGLHALSLKLQTPEEAASGR